MVVILSVFDVKIGPTAAIMIPQTFDQNLADENAKIMDIQSLPTDFVVKEYPSTGLKSINMQFNITSPNDRGKIMSLQLSAFISETYPAEKLVRSKIIECKNKLINDEMTFSAFKIDPMDVFDKKAMTRKRSSITKMMQWLDTEIKVNMPETSAAVIDRNGISTMLSFPDGFHGTASNDPGDLEDALVIYRRDSDGSITIKAFPSTRHVLKMRIIAENFTPKLMMEIMKCVEDKKLIYTTGLCQETTGKCLHESYFSIDTDGVVEKESIESRLTSFSFVKQFDVDVLVSSRA